MQIKRFEAKDMTSALRLIKKELGPDAVILSARSLNKANKIIGRVKSVGVEVTAAIDGYHPAAASALVAGAVNSYRRHESIGAPPRRNLRESVGSRIKSLYDRRRAPQPAEKAQSGGDDLLADVFQHLMSQEVRRDVANDIIEGLAAKDPDCRLLTKDRIIADISSMLAQKRNGTGVRFRAKSDCRVRAVVGPTGVGKTTTVAKLAARHAIEENKAVALISLDADRLGGTADLAVYAKAIGVPLKAAATRSALKAAINEFRRFDLILVDTPGFNPQKQDQIDDLKARLDGFAGVEIHLALPAMTKESDLVNTLRSVETLDVQHLILTKLDESCTCGNLINLLVRYPLPLSFMTHGREVPHNIKTGSMDKIVERLLAGFNPYRSLPDSEKPDQAPPEAAARDDGSGFAANKNSDVFHRRDCKWTQKIKSKNMISFSSAQEARLAHFTPCQDCHPARSSRFQVGLPVRDNIRISNYS